MSGGPSQPKVVGEVWDDERVASFLHVQPPAGEDADFHCLWTAYKSMRPDDFERFLRFYTEAGRNLDATGEEGRTLLAVVSEHRHGAPFAAALKQFGAQG